MRFKLKNTLNGGGSSGDGSGLSVKFEMKSHVDLDKLKIDAMKRRRTVAAAAVGVSLPSDVVSPKVPRQDQAPPVHQQHQQVDTKKQKQQELSPFPSSKDSTARTSSSFLSSTFVANPRFKHKRSARQSAVGVRHGLSGGGDVVDDDDDNVSSLSMKTIEQQEIEARDGAEMRSYIIILWDLLASFTVFAMYLMRWESLLTSATSSILVWYWYHNIEKSLLDNGSNKVGTMDKVLLTVAIITPLTMLVRLAFTRREQALQQIVSFSLININLTQENLSIRSERY